MLALLSTMIAIAAPGFGNLFQNNNLVEASNRFVSSLTFARSEAINRNGTVIVCHLNDARDGCDNDGRWEDGWVIWADGNGNTDFDPGEEIAIGAALAQNYTLRSGLNQFANRVTYSAAGDATGDVANGAEIFRLCDPSSDNTNARLIHFNGVGRAWVNRNPGIVGVPNCP